ncbi:SCO-spondin-like isoform X1 [Vidua macroura]|nr:SCO-spondin-like isoform X1 [Vidua macroura]
MEPRGGGAEGNGLCPPAQPGGGAARPELPPAQPSLLIQCPLERGRAIVPRGSQAPGAMQGALLWAGWLLATGCLVGATGSCRHRCCPGRNNACWAPGARRARCYCDSYCQRTGDCCQDYLTTCRRAAVGCAVGPWGPWSGCSSPCGVGSRARSRQVTVPPRHGGDPCPDLKQRRGCLGQHPTCGTAKAALLPEVAKILPNSFSQDFRDPWRRAGLPLPEEPSGYVWSRGPSVTLLPKAGTPLHPLRSWPLCILRPRAFLLPPAIILPALNHGPIAPPYKTMALCMPHRTTILPTLQTRIPLHPPRAITFSPPQPRPLCHPQTYIPFIPQSINKPPQPLPYLPTTIFPLFCSHFPPSPAPPSAATAAISA